MRSIRFVRRQPVLRDRVREVADRRRSARRRTLSRARRRRRPPRPCARARALGHHGGEVARPGGGLQHHLAADRQPEAADPRRVDVGAVLEERDAGADVLVEVPAPARRGRPRCGPRRGGRRAARRSRGARASAPGGASRAAREHDHRGAVARRHVPAVERQAVARVQRDVLVGGAELGRGDVGARDVRADVGDANGSAAMRERRRGRPAVLSPRGGRSGGRGGRRGGARSTARARRRRAAAGRRPGEQAGVVVAGQPGRAARSRWPRRRSGAAGDERQRERAARARAGPAGSPGREREERRAGRGR